MKISFFLYAWRAFNRSHNGALPLPIAPSQPTEGEAMNNNDNIGTARADFYQRIDSQALFPLWEQLHNLVPPQPTTTHREPPRRAARPTSSPAPSPRPRATRRARGGRPGGGRRILADNQPGIEP